MNMTPTAPPTTDEPCNNSNPSLPSTLDIVVFTTTFYTSPTDIRCSIALSTLKSLAILNIPTVVIDASPPGSGVFEALQSAGGALTLVKRQTSKGKKGVALREALTTAANSIPGVTADTWLAFQEPEKSNLPIHWSHVFRLSDSFFSSPLIDAKTGIVVPMRKDDLFKQTYPKEQYHSEMFGNMYLDSVARDSMRQHHKKQKEVVSPPPIDWLFGPFALRKRHINLWLNYHGETYDAQIVPMIRGIRLGVQVQSIEVGFEASKEMKEMEEGSSGFMEKRLDQLIIWKDLAYDSWTDDF